LTGRVVVAALGRETAAALARLGATADVLASAPLVEALADGLARHLATARGGPV
jgi:uroporphyrinogen-III synthase